MTENKRNLVQKTIENIMDTHDSYIRHIAFDSPTELSPIKFIDSLRDIIKQYDSDADLFARQESLKSSTEILSMIKKEIKDVDVTKLTEFRLSIQTQNEFPPDGITGTAFFETSIPHKYHPESHTETIYVDSVPDMLLDYFGSERIWEDSISQKELMDILGNEVIEFFKETKIPFYFESTLIDWNDETPDEVDLFFGENWDT